MTSQNETQFSAMALAPQLLEAYCKAITEADDDTIIEIVAGAEGAAIFPEICQVIFHGYFRRDDNPDRAAEQFFRSQYGVRETLPLYDDENLREMYIAQDDDEEFNEALASGALAAQVPEWRAELLRGAEEMIKNACVAWDDRYRSSQDQYDEEEEEEEE